MQIYITKNGTQLGPFTEEELTREITEGKVSYDDLAWIEGVAGWRPLRQIIAGCPPPPPSPSPGHSDAPNTSSNREPIPALGNVALPENIRRELKKYPRHAQMTCLECGYRGLTGVGEPAIAFWGKMFSWLCRIVAILIGIMTMVGNLVSFLSLTTSLILGFIIGTFWVMSGSFKKYFLHCPNCQTKLGPVKL